MNECVCVPIELVFTGKKKSGHGLEFTNPVLELPWLAPCLLKTCFWDSYSLLLQQAQLQPYRCELMYQTNKRLVCRHMFGIYQTEVEMEVETENLEKTSSLTLTSWTSTRSVSLPSSLLHSTYHYLKLPDLWWKPYLTRSGPVVS